MVGTMDVDKIPHTLYAVRDLTTRELIWNARGSAYKKLSDVLHKIERLVRANPEHTYELVTWNLSLSYPIDNVYMLQRQEGV